MTTSYSYNDEKRRIIATTDTKDSNGLTVTTSRAATLDYQTASVIHYVLLQLESAYRERKLVFEAYEMSKRVILFHAFSTHED